MAWEQRGDRSYFYRSVRSGTRVTKEYAGGGLVGMLAEECENEQREQRAYERARLEKRRAESVALERSMREIEQMSDALVRISLEAVGYRQHERGEWRRRRG
jgi:hypothetical protein